MTTDLFGTTPAIPCGTATTHHHGRRALTLGIAASAAIAMFLGGMGGTASAAPISIGTTMTVAVASAFSYTGIVGPYALINGVTPIVPGSTVTVPVVANVLTNNLLGYDINVTPTAAANDNFVSTPAADVIPITSLIVTNVALANGLLAAGAPMTASGTPLNTAHKVTKSAQLGDTLTDTYTLLIPNVSPATYSTSLTYTATENGA